jgi:hypothetical protein
MSTILQTFKWFEYNHGFAFYNSYKKNMLVELCVSNYATSDGLVNGAYVIFKTWQNIVKKPLYG